MKIASFGYVQLVQPQKLSTHFQYMQRDTGAWALSFKTHSKKLLHKFIFIENAKLLVYNSSYVLDHEYKIQVLIYNWLWHLPGLAHTINTANGLMFISNVEWWLTEDHMRGLSEIETFRARMSWQQQHFNIIIFFELMKWFLWEQHKIPYILEYLKI